MTETPTPSKQAHQLVEAADNLFTTGVMSHSGHANLSARLDGDRFLLTPGFVRGLRPEHLATVSLDGQLLEGELRSVSTEIIAMHSAVYRARPQVGAIIHTHSPAATAFAVAHRPLPCRTEPMLRFGQPEDVPVVPWGPRGSDVSVRGIADVLRLRPTTSAVLLANHGLLVFGPDSPATAHLVVAIEESAEAELAAAALGGAVDFPAGALEAVRASIARVAS
ncbi:MULTISPECIES: class II aldolase/adducin family protein [unclassified Kitasatospora]|uniref:class II aldolase/adducin family protein n=1 Tax=unclassified Kitasatospora TaxID=2633591 RepID=UPI00070F6A17|nr:MULTISPECIES: class II aldolase/adducin family protein [unclassified Kitasatospora]KQV14418.1 aldolase [Kitasatospora sp. Root107]KRB66246.1 aldolase [Kitasatospora sp. Root187]